MKKQKENYEVDEARMSGAEIGNLIERLQNLKPEIWRACSPADWQEQRNYNT